MQRVNEFQFYELAIAIHPLTEDSQHSKYSEIWLNWHSAGESLGRIFRERALEFCYDTANNLYAAIGAVVPSDFAAAVKKYGELPQPEPEIGWSLAYPIRQAAEKFETILAAELSNSDTYWVSPKGTHKTSMLMRSASSILPASITKDYPEASADFDEAGRCWLFDTYTAVGFHLMRATESVIREYYKKITGQDLEKK